MSPGLISVNDGAVDDSGLEIQNNILVHIRYRHAQIRTFQDKMRW